MVGEGPPRGVKVYTYALALIFVAVLFAARSLEGGFGEHVLDWVVLTVLLGLTEYAALYFYNQGGSDSWGLSAADAVFMPMVVGLSTIEAIWGAAAALFLARVTFVRRGTIKELFNLGQYGVSAAAAAYIWHLGGDPGQGFTPQNAAVAVVSVVVFAVLTHTFVAGALRLATGENFFALLRDVGRAAIWNLAGNITLGLFFTAAYLSSRWTMFLFPLPLAALYFGYRAVVRQSRERERVESLHAASRALASSPDLGSSLQEFLRSMADMVSATGARAVIHSPSGLVWSGVKGGVAEADMEPLEDATLRELVDSLIADPKPLVIRRGDASPETSWAESLRSATLIVVPLRDDDEVVGCLIATDRVGAEEFGENDLRLVEALGNELVLTLDSYRLFAQVAEERERFQQIFVGSKEGICLLDEDGVIKAWNPALARITGFDELDILGEKWSERVLVRDRQHKRIEGMDIITVSPDDELELVTRKGPPRWVSIMSGEVPSEDTKSWVVLVRDITREHELEESKSDFLSTISHELRTPLTTIKGSLQVLSRPNASANSEIGKQMIEIMKRGSDRLERLVMNLLAVSQMEAGDVQVYPDEVALEELVRSRIASILVDHPEVEVVAEDDVVVRADRERLSQAVEHVLDNARKFGPESGPIHVTIGRENGFARLSIKDEGPGIPKIDQDRIFDRFVRLGHVLTRETQGPGVGLFIARRSVEAMGGSIEVESEANQGATFHLRIPLARPMAAMEPASSA